MLGAGGSAVAAIAAGLLLSLRCLAFGLVMAPVMTWRRPARALAAQLMIDEAVAVGTASEDPALRRFGYLAAGLGVFVAWNLSTAARGDPGGVHRHARHRPRPRRDDPGSVPRPALAPPGRPGPAPRRPRRVRPLAVLLVPLTPAGVPVVAAAAAVLARPARGPGPSCARSRPGMSPATVVLLVLAAGVYLLKAAGPLLLGGRALPPLAGRVVALLPAGAAGRPGRRLGGEHRRPGWCSTRGCSPSPPRPWRCGCGPRSWWSWWSPRPRRRWPGCSESLPATQPDRPRRRREPQRTMLGPDTADPSSGP